MILESIPTMRNGRIKSSYKILCRCEDCGGDFRRPVKAAIESSQRCKSCTTTHCNLHRDPVVKAKMTTAAANVWRGKTREEVMGPERRELERQAQSVRNSGENNPNYGGVYCRGFADNPLTGTLESLYGESCAKKMREAASVRNAGKNNPMYGKPAPKKAGNGISGWWKDELYFRSLLELAFILKCESSGTLLKSAERKEFRFPYSLDGVDRTYTPDFVDQNDTLYEIKPSSLATSRSVKVKLQAAPCVQLISERELTRPTKPELHELIRQGLVKIDETKLWRIQ